MAKVRVFELAQEIGARVAAALGDQAAKILAERAAGGAPARDEVGGDGKSDGIQAARDVG